MYLLPLYKKILRNYPKVIFEMDKVHKFEGFTPSIMVLLKRITEQLSAWHR